jgi:hypothetical protein
MRPARDNRPNKLLLLWMAVPAIQVSWWVELALRPGCLENFAKLTGEMVASAQAENGVLAYQRFISEDGQTIFVHERYEHSGAASCTFAPLSRPLISGTRAWLRGSASWSSVTRATSCGRS